MPFSILQEPQCNEDETFTLQMTKPASTYLPSWITFDTTKSQIVVDTDDMTTIGEYEFTLTAEASNGMTKSKVFEVIISVFSNAYEPPFLQPEPATHVTAEAGDAVDFFIGQPTSAYENDVEVKIDVGDAQFFHFDEDASKLSVASGEAGEGIYEVQI